MHRIVAIWALINLWWGHKTQSLQGYQNIFTMLPRLLVWARTPRILLFWLFTLAPVANAVDFESCLTDIQSGKWGSIGGTDNRGNPVSDISNATAITYSLCVTACGSAAEPFNWSLFSQQFGSWLLPWLALVSQLPYGANDKLENFASMLLTVGSPTLAAYSLALTILNQRWVIRRFAHFDNPKAKNAALALASLQQSRLVVTGDNYLLESLVALPKNDDWWEELVQRLKYTNTWTISAGTSIAWVIIAYIFTLIDALSGDIAVSVAGQGQAIGASWLWLLPVIVGWLQLSPKCDSKRLCQAVTHANTKAYFTTESGEIVLASSERKEYAIYLMPPSDSTILRDEECTAPIYNYARLWSWSQTAEVVAQMFCAVSDKEKTPKIGKEEESTPSSEVSEAAALGPRCHWGPGVWTRFVLASSFALFLQWGTTGGGIIATWFTPPQGLGCRSGSLILYGILSTLVWVLLAMSSFLAHYSELTQHTDSLIRHTRRLSLIFRRVGKIIAVCNAVWIVLACIFQTSNVYDRCYCNSSYLGLGARAYNVISFPHSDVVIIRIFTIVGIVVSTGGAVMFLFLFNILFYKNDID